MLNESPERFLPNFLIDRDMQHVLFIDVDSYQTAGFPATAIMDSIRDRHSSTYSAGTDWFSFAILAFQMFVGVHPYRGKHATLAVSGERSATDGRAGNGVCAPGHACGRRPAPRHGGQGEHVL